MYFSWRKTKIQVLDLWFGVVHWLKPRQYRRNKPSSRRAAKCWNCSLQGGRRSWELGRLGMAQEHTAGDCPSVGGTWHLCVETPSISQMKQLRPCHMSHFSASVRFMVWGRWFPHFPPCHFNPYWILGQILSSTPDVYITYQTCFRGGKNCPLMDKQDVAVWGSETGWRAPWAACQVALLTPSWGQTTLLKARALAKAGWVLRAYCYDA